MWDASCNHSSLPFCCAELCVWKIFPVGGTYVRTHTHTRLWTGQFLGIGKLATTSSEHQREVIFKLFGVPDEFHSPFSVNFELPSVSTFCFQVSKSCRLYTDHPDRQRSVGRPVTVMPSERLTAVLGDAGMWGRGALVQAGGAELNTHCSVCGR